MLTTLRGLRRYGVLGVRQYHRFRLIDFDKSRSNFGASNIDRYHYLVKFVHVCGDSFAHNSLNHACLPIDYIQTSNKTH